MINLQRVVPWIGPVDSDSFAKVMGRIIDLHQKSTEEPIYLIITSGGGNVGISLAFYDLIRAGNINLVTIGAGYADSAATVIFLAGKERLITAHSTMEIHESETSFPTSRRKDELDTAKKWSDLAEQSYGEIFNECTGGKINSERLAEMKRRITLLTATQMIELGIATGVFR